MLDASKKFMKTDVAYNPYVNGKDYTFTGDIKPMKLVFFDLARTLSRIDDSTHSKPLEVSAGQIYSNKMMNFYGDSFHTTYPLIGNGQDYTFSWSYGDASPNQIVVSTPRFNKELGPISGKNYTYYPQQVNLTGFKTPFDSLSSCSAYLVPGNGQPINKWPAKCTDINGTAIQNATTANGGVGFMLLNGKRLGNLGAIEAIPNQTIIAMRTESSRHRVWRWGGMFGTAEPALWQRVRDCPGDGRGDCLDRGDAWRRFGRQKADMHERHPDGLLYRPIWMDW